MIPFLTPLTVDQLRSQNVPEPWNYGFADSVRFGELDVLGHVNNTVYLSWFENLRIRYFTEYGMAKFDEREDKIVIRNLGLDFKAEVKLHDDYIVTGRTVEIRNTSFTMQYAVWVNGVNTTTGHAVIVYLDPQNAKKPLPQHLRDVFISRDGAVQL